MFTAAACRAALDCMESVQKRVLEGQSVQPAWDKATWIQKVAESFEGCAKTIDFQFAELIHLAENLPSYCECNDYPPCIFCKIRKELENVKGKSAENKP